MVVDDPLARHKTLNYWNKRLAFEHAQARGADEAILRSHDGRIWEGSRTNLFVVLGREILTPPSTGPIVPGILRALVRDRASLVDHTVREADITADAIEAADEVFLTNSVRGVIPVDRWAGRNYRLRTGDRPVVALVLHMLLGYGPVREV